MIQPLIAVLISSLIAIRSYRKKSLDLSGAISGFIVMTIHIAVGYRFAPANCYCVIYFLLCLFPEKFLEEEMNPNCGFFFFPFLF